MQDFTYIEDMSRNSFYNNSQVLEYTTIMQDATTNNYYATIANLIHSKYTHTTFSNGLNCIKDMNSSNNVWNDGGNDAFDGWGNIRMCDGNGANELYIPFKTYNGADGVLYDNDFSYLGVNWHVKSGWTTTGIFMVDISQTSGTIIPFKMRWGGNLGSDGSGYNYVTTKNISQLGSQFNIYTHWSGGTSDPSITYTFIPYEIDKNKVQPFNYTSNMDSENVETIQISYGGTLYIQWGYPPGGVDSVQNWILSDLDFSSFIQGQSSITANRETIPINISSVGAYNDSLLNWNQAVTGSSTLDLFANISFDNGTNWMGWRTCKQGQPFPGLLYGMDLNNTVVKFKLVMSAVDSKDFPKFYGVNFTIYSAKMKYLVLDNGVPKTYVKNYDYLPVSANATMQLTSELLPAPVSDCSSYFNDTYKAWKAFNHLNDDITDSWMSANGITTGWVQYDFGDSNKKKLYKYAIRSRNNYTDINSAPKNWKLYGSVDKSTWDELDTQTEQTKWVPNERREFNVIIDNFYRFFRLNISSNNGNTSYVAVGELELYTKELTLINGSWVVQSTDPVTDDTFAKYGFDNINNLDYSKLYLLDNPQIAANITNTKYLPHLYINGYKNTTYRYKTELIRPQSISLLDDWSDYLSSNISKTYPIPSNILSSKDEFSFRVTAQQKDGKMVNNSESLKLNNTPPVISLNVIASSLLDLSITDAENDKVRFRISLNNKQIYPAAGTMSDYMTQPVKFKFAFGEQRLNIGGTNVVTVVAEDQNGSQVEQTAIFVGNYGGIMFKDENGQFYTDDLGQLLQYLDFGTIMAGRKTWVQKVILQNKNGYSIKNIVLSADQIPHINVEFGLTEVPFSATKFLTITDTLDPEDQKEFFIRLSTELSDVSFSGKLCIYAKADIVK